MTHDVEEFDVQRAHVKITGLVSSTADAQQSQARCRLIAA